MTFTDVCMNIIWRYKSIFRWLLNSMSCFVVNAYTLMGNQCTLARRSSKHNMLVLWQLKFNMWMLRCTSYLNYNLCICHFNKVKENQTVVWLWAVRQMTDFWIICLWVVRQMLAVYFLDIIDSFTRIWGNWKPFLVKVALISH